MRDLVSSLFFFFGCSPFLPPFRSSSILDFPFFDEVFLLLLLCFLALVYCNPPSDVFWGPAKMLSCMSYRHPVPSQSTIVSCFWTPPPSSPFMVNPLFAAAAIVDTPSRCRDERQQREPFLRFTVCQRRQVKSWVCPLAVQEASAQIHLFML
jgi:hypothetical protein